MPRNSVNQNKSRTVRRATSGDRQETDRAKGRSIQFRQGENEFTLDLHLRLPSAPSLRFVTLLIAVTAGIVQIASIDAVRITIAQIFGGR
jgi:hypothetical protein